MRLAFLDIHLSPSYLTLATQLLPEKLLDGYYLLLRVYCTATLFSVDAAESLVHCRDGGVTPITVESCVRIDWSDGTSKASLLPHSPAATIGGFFPHSQGFSLLSRLGLLMASKGSSDFCIQDVVKLLLRNRNRGKYRIRRQQQYRKCGRCLRPQGQQRAQSLVRCPARV